MVATSESKYRVIGTRPIRHDGLEKVTGRALYGADIRMGDLALGAVLRSPHAHANIKSIDISAAEQMPGVLGVITGKDMPFADLGEKGNVNQKFASNRVMAGDKVVFKGHPVAAVAAVDTNTALEAAAAIKVEYEVLSPVLLVREAIREGAPILHDDLSGDHLGESVSSTNIATHFRHELGHPDQAFADADVVVEREFELASAHQGYIEMQTSTAYWAPDGKITVWTSTQGSFGVRRQTAEILSMPVSKIKVIPREIGGGFGGKIPVYLAPQAALLAKKTGRPVKIVMTRADVFESTGPTPSSYVKIKLGADKSGKFLAADATFAFAAGAFPGSAVGAGAICVLSCYSIPNGVVNGYDVVVNKPRSAAYRAPGSTQVNFGIETVIDEIAEELGIDDVEIRLMNAAEEGTRRVDGAVYPVVGCRSSLCTYCAGFCAVFVLPTALAKSSSVTCQ